MYVAALLLLTNCIQFPLSSKDSSAVVEVIIVVAEGGRRRENDLILNFVYIEFQSFRVLLSTKSLYEGDLLKPDVAAPILPK